MVLRGSNLAFHPARTKELDPGRADGLCSGEARPVYSLLSADGSGDVRLLSGDDDLFKI